jgi:hypothetical protein
MLLLPTFIPFEARRCSLARSSLLVNHHNNNNKQVRDSLTIESSLT